jgi:hypothetical protein
MKLHLKGQGKCERISTPISVKVLKTAYSGGAG